MSDFENFVTGFILGVAVSWLAFCVYLDIKSKRNDRLIFLKWQEKARYWVGY